MRTLSAALQSALGGPVQRPAWLVELGMSSTVRLSSYGNVSWNGQSWTAADLDVSGLKVGALQAAGALVFGNADDAFGALFLNEGPTDKTVKIWGYDAAATAANDPVQLLDAVGAGAQIGTREVRVGLRDAVEYRLGPRAIVAPEYGFHLLLPAGRTLMINGVSITLHQRGPKVA